MTIRLANASAGRWQLRRSGARRRRSRHAVAIGSLRIQGEQSFYLAADGNDQDCHGGAGCEDAADPQAQDQALTLVAVGAIIAFAITAHVAFLNLQVAGWVFILTGVAGAISSRNSWLRRTLIVKGATGAAAAGGTGQRPPPSRRHRVSA